MARSSHRSRLPPFYPLQQLKRQRPHILQRIRKRLKRRFQSAELVVAPEFRGEGSSTNSPGLPGMARPIIVTTLRRLASADLEAWHERVLFGQRVFFRAFHGTS